MLALSISPFKTYIDQIKVINDAQKRIWAIQDRKDDSIGIYSIKIEFSFTPENIVEIRANRLGVAIVVMYPNIRLSLSILSKYLFWDLGMVSSKIPEVRL